MQQAPTRRRPKLQTTVAEDTLRKLNQIGEDTGLPNVGVTIDFVVHDWTKIKAADVPAATPEPVQ